MLISIESILYILFLEKFCFLKFYQYSPYLRVSPSSFLPCEVSPPRFFSTGALICRLI